MPLKLTLKANEKIVISGAVVRNGGRPTVLCIENTVPLLRERDILREKDADTPCRRLYFTIQLMYIGKGNDPQYHDVYHALVRDIIIAAPSTSCYLDDIAQRIAARDYYHALKCAGKLIKYEGEVLNT